ncbi:FAD-binding protein, partial [Escherichia coli]|nr:FAD-binding protein [Escherichia coli]
MQTFQADLAVIGAGGAGLRAAIAAAQANPNAKIALISKVYPMRSHTVAAEGGSAAVAQDHDSFEYHFH